MGATSILSFPLWASELALGGPKIVAELSGRSKRFQCDDVGQLEYVSRGGSTMNRINEQGTALSDRGWDVA